jgi:hypothetical protein
MDGGNGRHAKLTSFVIPPIVRREINRVETTVGGQEENL